MSSVQDPEELVICPYDPVHRVAAKKLPYHISKCRKQYDKNGEYKTCPFNARHVIPAPEFHYHMETCDSKGAIDMEIAFEQSKNEISNTVKGCTEIPPPPTWNEPNATENWDDEDVDAPPVLRTLETRFQPPANLPRPTASRPISGFDLNSSPISRKKSPSRFPGEPMTPPRGGRNSSSSRASQGRQLPSYGFGDELFSSSVRPRPSPSPDNESLSKEIFSPPLPQDQSYFHPIPTRDSNAGSADSSAQPSIQALPEQQTISSPLQYNNQASHVTPQPVNSYQPQPSHEHLSQSSQAQQPDPLVSYQNLQHNISPTQVPVCNQHQMVSSQPYPPQPQQIQYFNPPMSVPLSPQAPQPYLPPNSQQYAYTPQMPQLHYLPPTNQVQPASNYYLQPQPYYQNAQPPNALQQTAQPPNALQQNAQLPPNALQQNAQLPPNALQQTAQLPSNALQQTAQPYPPVQPYNANPQPSYYQYPASIAGSQGSVQRPPGPGLSGVPTYAPAQNPYAPPISSLVPQGNMYPSGVSSVSQYEQSAVATPGASSPGRGRGRGLSQNSSPPRTHYPSPQNPYQSVSMQPLLPQMEQLQISNQSVPLPTQQIQPTHTLPQTQSFQLQPNAPQFYPQTHHQQQQQQQQAFYPTNQQQLYNNAFLPHQSSVQSQPQNLQQPYQAAQVPAQLPQPNNSNPRKSIFQSSVAAHPNLGNGISAPLQQPKPGGAHMATSRLNRVKVNLATITLIEHKRASGTALTQEEVELLESKSALLEQLK